MSNNKKKFNDNFKNLLKVYSHDDEYINKIGQILTSKKSREIFKILSKVELNTKELAKLVCDEEETPRLSNLICPGIGIGEKRSPRLPSCGV